MRRIVADTTHVNIGSQRVMEKTSMRRFRADEHLYFYEISDNGPNWRKP